MNEGFVDVAAIEKELQKLWVEMGAQKGEQEAVTRACVHNLIVYAPGERSDAEVNTIIAEVTVQNPGRVFILLPEPSSPKKKTSAWVSAQCYRTSGMRQQVCCEQIMVRAHGEAVQELPSIIAPLILPDLPVFVWWRAPLADIPVFNELLEFADRTIIDTAIEDASQEIQEVTKLLVRNISICAFSDLNWARLTIWRELIARLFDAPDFRSQLSEITRVEISGERPFSFQPLFLVSWLGSRLQWRVHSKIKNENGNMQFQCINGSNRIVDISISKLDKPLDGRNLESVRLRTDSTRFTVSSTAELFHVEVSLPSTGKISCTHDKKFVPQSEADLLRKELQILSRDRAYEQALQFLNSVL